MLEGLQQLERTPLNAAQRDNVEGSALFFRSLEFYNLAQQFVKPYNGASAETGPGLPLRLNTGITENTPRATLKQTYDQLFSDLKRASLLLPETQAYKTRPSRAAAFSLLARAYLTVEDYGQALAYADSALAISGELLDYNSLDMNTTFKIPLLNREVIFQASVSTSTLLEVTRKIVDSVLYASYDDNDLRKTVFFYDLSGKKIFTGSYLNGEYNMFGGIAADEIYLIRAECLARTGKGTEAVDVLNTLLRSRWARNTFPGLQAADDREALRLVLAERRKELLFRNLRWSDLRRLNKDPEFAVTLQRSLNGRLYSLPPNSERYTLPIPPDEILLSGIPQN